MPIQGQVVKMVMVEEESQVLKGPIVSGQVNNQIIFQDIGTGKVWDVELTDVSRLFQFSPNGCDVVVLQSFEGDTKIGTLSIFDFSFKELPPLGTPIWTLDNENIIFLSYNGTTQSTKIYISNNKGEGLVLLNTINEAMLFPQWLSNDELIYQSDGYEWLVWNIKTNNISNFYNESEIIPNEFSQQPFYNTSNISPDHKMIAGFFDFTSFRGATSDNTSEGITELMPLKPQIPGFDIFFMKENTRLHVDISEQFIQSLVWASTSSKIAITTDYDGPDYGVFVYDLKKNRLQRLGDAYNDYQFYIPSWSSNDEWLAFRTPNGYIAQHLLDGNTISLDKRLTAHQLFWSPIMDYSNTICSP